MSFFRDVVILCTSILLSNFAVNSSAQGVSPGPYEILPFQDAYIVEAFTDLLPNTNQIADWTGWTSYTWESPNAYDNHGGTDFSVGTGTPCYAIATGEVIEVEKGVPQDTHPNNKYYGNFVKIKPDAKSPLGETLTVLTAHMLPNISVNVGDRVVAGRQIGYTDNTGNSTSEHCHVESALFNSSKIQCAFYHAHYKYPIMFNPTATKQVGHVLKVKKQTPLRVDRFDSSAVVTQVYPNQLLFASFAKRGYYRVFLPNDTINRSLWVRATDVEEYFGGTVIQPLPDAGAYVHNQQLAFKYPIYDTSSTAGNIVGRIYWAGGRFVADQVLGDWYHISVPSSTGPLAGWVKADLRMVVYPELVNPTINLAQKPNDNFPMVNNFTTVGALDYGRPKFDRRSVVSFSPTSPGGDGKALLLTDNGNTGHGNNESVSYGRPEHADYYAQAHVYFRYRPSYGGDWTGYERYGIFLRDDGFGGFDETFEGMGNCYLMMYDARTGQVTCGKSVDASITNFATSPAITKTTDGWYKMRIEAVGTLIRYYLDDVLVASKSDNTFISGLCGMNYTGRLRSNGSNLYPTARGAYFDNFKADALPSAKVNEWSLY